MMAYVFARLITLPTVAIGSAWLILRYRAAGVIVSIFVGWAILFAVYRGFPAPPGEWDEDGEKIGYLAPILMMIWSFLIWVIASLWSSVARRGNTIKRPNLR
jgi:hypothetical protein